MKIIVFSGDYSAIYATGNRTRFMNAKPALAALLMTVMLFASPAAIADQRTAQEDIPSNAAGTGIHDSLVAALDRADLVATLSGDGPFTVFAPTDDAFTAAGIDLDSFNTDDEIATLVDILTYHVLAGAVNSSQVTDGMTATMLNGDDVTFSVTDGTVMIGDATVTAADVMASNGIIHVIDKVLMPPVPVTEADGDICYNMYTHTIAAGASFDECMAYAYYENYEMNGQTFTGCYNLVTHTFTMVSQAECEAYMWTPAVDIAMTAQATTIHNSLVAALAQAELVTTLQGEGPYTVFAPTDDAFAEAGIDLAALDNEEGKDLLTDILLYHVISGEVPSSAVTDGLVAEAVNGDDLTFSVGEGVMVNDANVVLADVPASNGVIHVIDKVLMPPVPITEEDGDVCYNIYTHTIAAHASFDECMSYVYLVDYDLNGETFTGCYNMVTHAGRDYVQQEECESYMWAPAADIVMTAQATTIHHYRDLTALVAALAQAELVATLQGDGPFTVFAPSDQAFAEAGIDLAALNNEEGKALLTDILLYHVVSGAVPSSAVTDGLVAAAVNGDDLTFTVGEGVMVNDANVIMADVPASNGVIHVIDKVLMPPADAVDTSECDEIIGIDDTGLAYDKPYVEVDVGATVCWIWNDESMAHNVAQIAMEGDTTRYMGGVYSGESMTTVDYRYTFDIDQTFNYICEPHATSGMAGQIVVGEGSIVEPEEESNNTPGFSAGIAALAVIGALMIAGRRLR
ncbi:MAG: fasciclin domain-containing protein [Candidatus Thalassarchaeum sp.]|nr:fasciclin domain-containing protein [Candidatus Thalassarchaeum sp.]